MLIWLWLACVAKPLPAAAQTVSHKVTQQANVAVVKGQQQPKTAKTSQQQQSPQPRMGIGSAVPGASETPDDSDEEEDSDDDDDIEDDDSEMDGEEDDSDEDVDSEDDDDDLDDDD